MTVSSRPALAGTQHQRSGYEPGGAPYDIPHLALVKNDILTYYGDDGTTDGNATSASEYAQDVRRVERKAAAALPGLIRRADAAPVVLVDVAPVVLVDVDDTTLLTYRYEATHDFGYDPVVNAAYIHDTGMPKVFGMPRLLRTAASAQARVYYLTGRPETQRADTERDLAAAGYPSVVSSHPAGVPPLRADLHDDQYTSPTRRHIERIRGGQDIVLNLGDQFSDLRGGYFDRTLKVPNPMYYLP